MTTTEALPSYYVLFLIPIPLWIFYGIAWFANRAYSKCDYPNGQR